MRDGSYRVALPRAIVSMFLLADGCIWSGIWSELDFASRNASKNNLGFFGIRVPKDQDGAVYCFCECGRV
ncbi:hypothetical protein DY000_02004185 [Brassica cretica]|uniref:Uncharacterized protein n=1 Tax=Brassica cretica TaxID=69181 RepID=A0ABQ7C1S0_BRACR|nr:hypothetical protein DY000_02004185 [Brassica cretica]